MAMFNVANCECHYQAGYPWFANSNAIILVAEITPDSPDCLAPESTMDPAQTRASAGMIPLSVHHQFCWSTPSFSWSTLDLLRLNPRLNLILSCVNPVSLDIGIYPSPLWVINHEKPLRIPSHRIHGAGIFTIIYLHLPEQNHPVLQVPSGELTVCNGKSPFLMGKSTINIYKWQFSIAFCMFTRG